MSEQRTIEQEVDLPLKCELADGVITVRIGLGTLAFCATEHPKFWMPDTDVKALKITDAVRFAKDVVLELNREEEDGSTPLTNLLDKAIEAAVDQGSEGVDYEALEQAEDGERSYDPYR